MCELLAIQSNQPVPVDLVLRHAEMLDEYGVAGFSWGIVWKTESGGLQRYRSVDGIRRDQLAQRALAGVTSTKYLVHLRRPSLMTSISQRNAQPYLDSARATAFCHNGYFAKHGTLRASYRDRMEGTSDSEVGYCYYQDHLQEGVDPSQALLNTHQALGGRANIGVMLASGSLLFYAGNEDNRAYAFDLHGAHMVTTALHSQDDYVFQTVFPAAEHSQQLEVGTVYAL